ncbi:MAG TPA: AI-2E family transporter [Ideonella sp.]|nr:AI-2E family transporter [Ideonella sp.]
MNKPAPLPAQPVEAAQPNPLVWAVRAILFVALLLLAREARAFLAPVMVAVVLTFVLVGPMRRLRRAGIPEPAGAALLLGSLLISAVLLGSLLAAPAAEWLKRAPTTVSHVVEQLDRVRAVVPVLAAPKPAARAASAPVAPLANDPLKERLATEGVALTGVMAAKVLSFALSAAATMILLFCLLVSQRWMLARAVQAIEGRRRRAVVLAAIRNAQRDIGRFLGTLTLVNVSEGLAITAAMAALGLPSPLLWGTVAAVLNFIPYIGPVIITTLLLLAGMSAFDTMWQMLGPPLAFLAINAIECNLVSPWAVGRRVALNPLAVFLSVMFWGWLWGFVGALIAVPMLIGLRSACKRHRGGRLIALYLSGLRPEERRALPSLRTLMETEADAVRPLPQAAEAARPAQPAASAARAKPPLPTACP